MSIIQENRVQARIHPLSTHSSAAHPHQGKDGWQGRDGIGEERYSHIRTKKGERVMVMKNVKSPNTHQENDASPGWVSRGGKVKGEGRDPSVP